MSPKRETAFQPLNSRGDEGNAISLVVPFVDPLTRLWMCRVRWGGTIASTNKGQKDKKKIM
jgi:hypothetical protein